VSSSCQLKPILLCGGQRGLKEQIRGCRGSLSTGVRLALSQRNQTDLGGMPSEGQMDENY